MNPYDPYFVKGSLPEKIESSAPTQSAAVKTQSAAAAAAALPAEQDGPDSNENRLQQPAKKRKTARKMPRALRCLKDWNKTPDKANPKSGFLTSKEKLQGASKERVACLDAKAAIVKQAPILAADSDVDDEGSDSGGVRKVPYRSREIFLQQKDGKRPGRSMLQHCTDLEVKRAWMVEAARLHILVPPRGNGRTHPKVSKESVSRHRPRPLGSGYGTIAYFGNVFVNKDRGEYVVEVFWHDGEVTRAWDRDLRGFHMFRVFERAIRRATDPATP